MKSSQFCVPRMAEIKKRIDNSTDTSVVGMPGVGIATFLIELSKQPFGYMIFIDAHVIPQHTTADLCKALLQRLGGDSEGKSPEEVIRAVITALRELCKQHDRIVISIGGFDQLQANFNHELFHTLITFKGVDRQKIVYMFGVCKRLDSLLTDRMMDTDLRLLSSVYYLKPYKPADLRHLLPIYGSASALDNPRLEALIEQSGGNFQFLRLLLSSQRQENPARDPFIKLAFSNIYALLTSQQKLLIRQMAQRGTSDKSDEFLLGIGLIVEDGRGYKLFSKLFQDCVLAYTLPRLPAKEQKLFRLLKKNLEQVVSKNTIYDTIWPNSDDVSEWALNALVYRLRKHPAFLAQNYSIENHKKLGYTLVKNS